jgi:hypothetical protein
MKRREFITLLRGVACPYRSRWVRPFEARRLGDTEGDTHGIPYPPAVSPSCVQIRAAVQFVQGEEYHETAQRF